MLDNQLSLAFLAFYFALIPSIYAGKPACSETRARLRIPQEYGAMMGVSHVTGSILERVHCLIERVKLEI